MATAKKLPSGSWRCLVYGYTDSNNKRHYKSFTANTKKEAERLAANYAVDKQESIAIPEYISNEVVIKNGWSIKLLLLTVLIQLKGTNSTTANTLNRLFCMK